MAEIAIDLSGARGLADNFYGDTDTITPQPQLRNRTKEGELAGGLFNPYIRSGYLHPVPTNTTTVTPDIAPASEFGSVAYDYENDDLYFADRQRSLYKLDGLNDQTLTRVEVFEGGTDDNPALWDELHDLEIYEINGVKKMFAVGKGLPLGEGPLIETAYLDAGAQWRSLSISVPPSGSTKPTIVYTGYDWYATWGTSTINRTANSTGTDRRVYLVLMKRDGTLTTPTSVTFNGLDLSEIYRTSNLLGVPTMMVYELKNAPLFSGNIVITWASTPPTNLAVYSFVLNGASTTRDADIKTNSSGSTTTSTIASHSFQYTDINALNLVTLAARSEYTESSLVTTVRDEVESGILSTGIYTDDFNGYGLQVAYGDLPWSMNRDTWLASRAQGGFTTTLNSDYAFMRSADNGFAYIFADNAVHKIDGGVTGGEEGTVTKNVLLLPEYFRITDAIDYRSRIYMAIHQYPVSTTDTDLDTYAGKCGILVWNRISTQTGGTDFIEVPGVREIKRIYASPDGMIKLLTISNSGLTEIRRFGYNDSGGVVFPVTKTLGVGAYPQYPDGLTIANNTAMWIGNDGKLYTEEDIVGEERFASVNRIFQFKTPGTTESGVANNIQSGAIFYGSSSETATSGTKATRQGVYASYMDGVTVTNVKVYPFDLTNGSNTSQTPNQGDVYSGVTYIPITSVVRSLRVYNAPIIGTGSDVIATVKLYFNQSTSATMPDGMVKSITKDEAKRGYVDFSINKPYVHAVQIEVEWATSVPLGPDTYLPSVAVISTDDTRTKSPDNG